MKHTGTEHTGTVLLCSAHLCFCEHKRTVRVSRVPVCPGRIHAVLPAIPYPSATSSAIIRLKPRVNIRTPMWECRPWAISGISSSTTT